MSNNFDKKDFWIKITVESQKLDELIRSSIIVDGVGYSINQETKEVKEYSINKPEFNTWHSRFHSLVSKIEETQNFPTISRHVIGLDNGTIYPKFEEVDKKEFIENLKVPGNKTMHYDDIFNKAVAQVQQTWKALDEAIYGTKATHLEYFADWNLDNGRISSGKLEYWA